MDVLVTDSPAPPVYIPTITLRFYRGVGLPGFLVRWWTKSPFAHVAVQVDQTIYEALGVGGVISRPFYSDDHEAVAVPLPDPFPRWGDEGYGPDDAPGDAPFATVRFLRAQVGKPYDWQAILFDVIGVLLGPRARLNIAGTSCWDCSRLAAEAVRRMGFPGVSTDDLRCPVSPGDLYRMLTAAAPSPAQK